MSYGSGFASQLKIFNEFSGNDRDPPYNEMFAGDEKRTFSAFNTSSVGYLWTGYNIVPGEYEYESLREVRACSEIHKKNCAEIRAGLTNVSEFAILFL